MRAALVHGAGADHRLWEPVLSRLGAALTDVAALAAWLGARLRSSGAAPAVIVGHSLGGAIALELSLSAPELVRGLVLVSTGARLRVGPAIRAAVEEAAARGTKADLRALTYAAGTPPAVVEAAEEARAATSAASELADWRACDGFDRMAEVERITAPALVLVGAEDALTPLKYARYLAERIAGAELRVVSGAGHMLPVERPEEVTRAIEALAALAGA